MRRQASKRNRYKNSGYLPPFARLDFGGTERIGWMYREVDELSTEKLNNATRNIRGKNVQRILDRFTLTLVYPEKLAKVHARSPLKNPPSVQALSRKLGDIGLESMRRPAKATVVDVKQFHNSIGIQIDYDDLEEERTAIDALVCDSLALRRPYSVSSGRPHISIVRGANLSHSQVSQIKSVLPDTIPLSPVQAPKV